MVGRTNSEEFNFELIEQIAVLGEYDTGWTKELNLVSWNGGAAKYDIREWDPTHRRMSRGVTLQEREMRSLLDALKRRRRNMARTGAWRKEERESFAGIVADSVRTTDSDQSVDVATGEIVESNQPEQQAEAEQMEVEPDEAELTEPEEQEPEEQEQLQQAQAEPEAEDDEDDF